MKKNFQLGQSNEIIKDGIIFDLHNCYDFKKITLQGAERSLKIFFQPSHSYRDKIHPVYFFFSFLNYLEFSPGFGTRSISNIDEIGYKTSGDQDDEWLLSEEQSTLEDHLFFRLSKIDFIRVHSHKAFFNEIE